MRAYLENRAIFPESYSAPRGWYCGKYKTNAKELPQEAVGDMTAFYTEKLAKYPDVVTSEQLCAFTGYCKSTVNRWCRVGHLKCFGIRKFNVPKVYFIEFLNSIHFRAINIKSKKHIALLFAYRDWRIAHLQLEKEQAMMEKKEGGHNG